MAPPDEPPLPAPSPEPPVAAPYAEAPAPPPLAEPDEPAEAPTAADAAEAPPAETHSPVSPAATAAPFEEEPVAPSEPPFAHAPAAGSLPPPFTEAPVAPHAPEVAPPAIYEPPPVPSAHESPPPATAPSPEPPVAPPYAEAPPPPEEPAAPAYPPPMAEEPAAPAIPPAPSAYGPPPAPPAAPPYEPPASPPPAPAPSPAMPDLGPVEPDVDRPRETEAPPLPAFMPSLTGATPSAELPVEEVVASSQRVLAGTAIGDAMMLWQLGRLRRRGRRRDAAPDPLELSLEQTARMDSLRLIEAAMRHLRATTVAKLLPKPRVICVRTGAYGLEILLEEPVKVPEGWQSASGGYVLELPREVSVEELDAAGPGLSLCPALVPVGDTAEGPLLLNLEEISCLAVSGPSNPTASLLTSVVEVLGSSPLAGDIRIITVGISAPSGPGWERIHALSFDSPHLENLLATADSPAHAGSSDVLVIGPGNDLLFQRAGQIATSPGSRLMLVGATSSVAARWPWRIHVDEQHRAVVLHPRRGAHQLGGSRRFSA
ncbi:MAG: hypothetical protein OXH20_09425, partial [bacterium]|nr:hypothetical protein [bacterium]